MRERIDVISMKIAILGSNSRISKDLIVSFLINDDYELFLFSRQVLAQEAWLNDVNTNEKCKCVNYSSFEKYNNFDVIINFVGVGDPSKCIEIGSSIIDITQKYDELAINYIKKNTNCKYIFLSSGAVYGSKFSNPANQNTLATLPINNIKPQNWYTIAKLQAEIRHRMLPELSIIDIRMYNYFSHTQDLNSRFFISEIVRSIRYDTILETSSENITRDYIGIRDFYQIVVSMINTKSVNDVIDIYSKGPVDKLTLLETMKNFFNLSYELYDNWTAINATGDKMNYFSENHRAQKYGYNPINSSLDTIIYSTDKILRKAK